MNIILIKFLNHVFNNMQKILPITVNFMGAEKSLPNPVRLDGSKFHIFDFQESEVFYMGEFDTFSESRKCIHLFMDKGDDIYLSHHSKFHDFVKDKHEKGETFILLSCPEGKTISDKIESV